MVNSNSPPHHNSLNFTKNQPKQLFNGVRKVKMGIFMNPYKNKIL